MNKITYLCFVVLFCISFGLSGQTSEIQRVRIDFVSPLDFTQHLLLAFIPNDLASDGVDYGYDGPVFYNYPDDLNWMIEDKRYLIQGVGTFNSAKYYPLGMFLTNSGEIEIALDELENFDTPIDVYVYDAQLNTFTSINDSNYVKSLSKGDYLDRFYITFTNDYELIDISAKYASLSIEDNVIGEPTFKYLKGTNELLIKTNSVVNLTEVSLYNILGKNLYSLQNIKSNSIRIPLLNLKTNSSLIVSLTTEDGKHSNKHIITR